MKISIAQIKPSKGDVLENIIIHKRLIEFALSFNVSAIFFPELSLTGYEPELANDLAMPIEDERLNIFQTISDANNITIGVGIPLRTNKGIRISMVIFQSNKLRQVYSKQQLHSGEYPFFENGNEQLIITIGNKKIAPAICYESLQSEHADKAFSLGAEIYLASVAKPENGIIKALKHYPEIAKKHSATVLMANCVGYCDNFLSLGKSAVWNKNGQLLCQLEDQKEGIITFDTETEEVIKHLL